MKKRFQTGVYLILYIFLLAYMADFDVRRLVDIKSFFILLTGIFLLSLPFCHKGITKSEFLYIYGSKATEAGLIQVFLLIFVLLSESSGTKDAIAEIALCFRPMLYAFCIRVILSEEDITASVSDKEMHDSEKTQTEDQSGIPSYEDCMAAGLTRREAEIALLICQKYSNKEIAESLVISETTVKKHISNIFEKTGISKREELVGYLGRCKTGKKDETEEIL